jgi:hypothetical protein
MPGPVAEGEELGSNILHVDDRNTAHLSACWRGSLLQSGSAQTDMPIVPRLTHRRRADRRRKPCDALNSRQPQRLRRALRVACWRERVAAFVVPAADLFVFFVVPAADLLVFAIFLLASFRPDAVVTVRLAAERFFARGGLPIDPFAPPFRTVVFLATATLPAPILDAALLATPFLPELLLAARFCARRFAPALSFAVRRKLPARLGAFVALFFLRRTVLSRGISTAGLGSVTTVRPRNLRPGSTMSVETADSVKSVLGFAGVLCAGMCWLSVGTVALVPLGMTLCARGPRGRRRVDRSSAFLRSRASSGSSTMRLCRMRPDRGFSACPSACGGGDATRPPAGF